MLKPEELKNKNFKVFLGMPMYGGMLAKSHHARIVRSSAMVYEGRSWFTNSING